jgi:hypothetical protein
MAEKRFSSADTTAAETLLDQAAEALQALESDNLIAFACVNIATAREALELRRRWLAGVPLESRPKRPRFKTGL